MSTWDSSSNEADGAGTPAPMSTSVEILTMALNVAQDHSVTAALFLEDSIAFIHGSFRYSMKKGSSGFTPEAPERSEIHPVDIVVSTSDVSKMHGYRALKIQIKHTFPQQLRINVVPYTCTRSVEG